MVDMLCSVRIKYDELLRWTGSFDGRRWEVEKTTCIDHRKGITDIRAIRSSLSSNLEAMAVHSSCQGILRCCILSCNTETDNM